MTANLQLRDLYIKAKFYRTFAVIFSLVGVGLFVYMYIHLFKGNLFYALSTPDFVVIILIPFVPAAALSWLAMRLERKTKTLYRESRTATSKDR